MSEERLKEIKNIFDMADIYGDDFEIARELYNEVIRLRKQNEILKQNNVNEILRDDLVLCTKQYKKSEEKLEKANKKIDKLNNIINESKTYIQMNINATCNMNNDNYNEGRYNANYDILDKIKELEK